MNGGKGRYRVNRFTRERKEFEFEFEYDALFFPFPPYV
jgi:hypothetical protein